MLQEDVLYSEEIDVYTFLDGNDYSSWIRAAMFDFVLEMKNSSTSIDDEDDTMSTYDNLALD